MSIGEPLQEPRATPLSPSFKLQLMMKDILQVRGQDANAINFDVIPGVKFFHEITPKVVKEIPASLQEDIPKVGAYLMEAAPIILDRALKNAYNITGADSVMDIQFGHALEKMDKEQLINFAMECNKARGAMRGGALMALQGKDTEHNGEEIERILKITSEKDNLALVLVKEASDRLWWKTNLVDGHWVDSPSSFYPDYTANGEQNDFFIHHALQLIQKNSGTIPMEKSPLLGVVQDFSITSKAHYSETDIVLMTQLRDKLPTQSNNFGSFLRSSLTRILTNYHHQNEIKAASVQ